MKKRNRVAAAILAVILSVMTGCASKKETPSVVETTVQETETTADEGPEELAEEDQQCRLEDDYYEYVNGTFLDDIDIPADSYQWSYFYQLNLEAYETLNTILLDTVEKRSEFPKGSTEQKIADMYLTAMDMEGRTEAGIGGLSVYADEIKNASTIEEYVAAIGKLSGELPFFSLLTVMSDVDMGDSTRYAYYIYSPDMGPGKETLEDESLSELNRQYREYIGAIMKCSGMEEQEAVKAADEIFDLQKQLAAASLSLENQFNPNYVYNLYTEEELSSLLSNVDVKSWLKSMKADNKEPYIVMQPELMGKVNEMLTEENLELLKNYSLFCLYNDLAPYLTPEIRDIQMDWINAQNGIQEKKDDEKLAGEMVQGMLGFEFGKLYVQQCFSEADKQNVEAMVRKMITVYEQKIDDLDWMGEETKASAKRKLEMMDVKVGYPDQWPDYYADADITPPEEGGCLIDNMIELFKCDSKFSLERFDQPVDRSLWMMTPQTVNAYYNPSANEIVFPAAILQAPFYDSTAGEARNMGGVGIVIAHEISHAFDDSGALYDEYGNYKEWWTEEDKEKFNQLTQKVVAYYDEQEGFEGRHVTGAQTLGENIADLGAVSCVSAIVGDDQEQLKQMFEQFAIVWASKFTDESMIQRLNTDVHSPAKVRVNAAARCSDAFYIAYPEIKEGDGMYLAPDKRVKIW